MRLGRLTNGINNEAVIQGYFGEWLQSQGLKYVAEAWVKQVNRRPDFLVYKECLINVEAKCNATKTLIAQLKSNARYSDYSFALIPDYAFTPRWFKTELASLGYGLIIYNHDNQTITEVLEAHHNKPDKELRREVYYKHIDPLFKKK